MSKEEFLSLFVKADAETQKQIIKLLTENGILLSLELPKSD